MPASQAATMQGASYPSQSTITLKNLSSSCLARRGSAQP